MFTAKKLLQIQLTTAKNRLAYVPSADRMQRIRIELEIMELERKIAKADNGEMVY